TPEKAGELLRANAKKRALAGMKEACNASWQDLLAHPMGGALAKQISPDSYACVQASNALGMNESMASKTLPNLCMAGAGVSLLFPPAELVVTAVCAAALVNSLGEGVDTIDKLKGQKQSVLLCAETDPKLCDSKALAAKSAQIEDATMDL